MFGSSVSRPISVGSPPMRPLLYPKFLRRQAGMGGARVTRAGKPRPVGLRRAPRCVLDSARVHLIVERGEQADGGGNGA